MSNKLTRWLESDDLFPKQGIDDVLMLSTGENLEMHAHTAAREAETRLDEAEGHEQEMGEDLAKAQTKYGLAVAALTNTERLGRSIVSVLNRLRSK